MDSKNMVKGLEFVTLRGVSPSTKFLSSQKFVWAPARNFLSSKNYTPPFDSPSQVLPCTCLESQNKNTAFADF